MSIKKILDGPVGFVVAALFVLLFLAAMSLVKTDSAHGATVDQARTCRISAGEAKSGSFDCGGDKMGKTEKHIDECAGLAGIGSIKGGWWGAGAAGAGCFFSWMMN